jgi:glucose-6-phosphate dehydrogenase assembly protein OpcA
MTETITSLASSKPRQVDIADIESELSELWRSLAGESHDPNAVTRACALTLVVYVDREEAVQEVNDLIAQLTRQTPCRAIIVAAQPETQPAGVSAWISAHCHLPVAAEKQVCCEQISIRVSGRAVEEADKLILPLTVSGLPVYLWWRAGRFDPLESFGQVLRISNRVLVDSARFQDSEGDLVSLAGKLQDLSPTVLFSDLNWTRLTPWRDLTAQFFDLPENRSYLEDVREVCIEYENRSSRRCAQRAQALLYAGWLSSRLGWQRIGREAQASEKGSHCLFKSRSGAVRVECVPRDFEGSGAGVCFSIQLKCGQPPARFSLARGKDGKSVWARAETPGRPAVSRAVRLEVQREVEIVNQELMFLGRDRNYEEALAAVARMVKA